jgi:tetratricopeptide (TPR) repeat protein
MSESDLNNTQPSRPQQEKQPDLGMGDTKPTLIEPNAPSPIEKKNFPSWLVFLIILTLMAIGLMGGYGSGMGQRYAAKNTLVTGQLAEQYQLGTQAMQTGNYELARQYFEFIIRTDSNFPGVQAAYTDLLLRLQVSPTPVFSPTPLVSPTPDLRGTLEIFNTALQLLNASDWNGAIINLDSLRKTNPTYRTAEVDGMYYMALRERGVQKITVACQDVNLEGGIYDLTLAEHFVGTGNLDSVAESLRTYARLYIIGASFWDQDWFQAQNFFAQVMGGYPNMSDSSCMNATSRWVQSTIKVADMQAAAGDYCTAAAQYASAFTVNDPFNPTAFPTATEIWNLCNGGSGGGGGGETQTPTATLLETPTPTPCPTDSVSGSPVCP